MSRHEEVRARHLADWGSRIGDRLERRSWDRATIEAHQTAAVRALVGAARERSPWHAARLAHVDIDQLDAHDLRALPTMTKADLMGSFDQVMTDARATRAACEAHLLDRVEDGYLADELHVVASGGSSGERGVFVYGWEAWIDVHLGLARHLIADRLEGPADEHPAPMGLVAAANATHMTTAVAATFANPMLDVRAIPVTRPVAEIVAGLNDVQPGTLTTYASMLGVLAAEAACGRLRIAPRRIISTSEPLLPEVRLAAESAFSAPVANVWGTSEGGVMAVGCWQAEGMHLNEDLVLIEPVDADGRVVPPGARADKVLLTNLFNTAQPLIRYELTDEVVILTEPCPCGSAHRRVADVQGRHDDLFRYATTVVHPHVVRSVLAHHLAIADYQVHQSVDGVEVAVVPAPGGTVDVCGLEDELQTALGVAGLQHPGVTLTEVPALDRHVSTGKVRRFVPLSR